MATQADVRRIALALPDTSMGDDGLGFSVRNGTKDKGFAWAWKERLDPKQARVANPDVFAVRVANGAEKQMLIESDPEKFFTEPHYNGFPAVLVRLAAIEVDELEELIIDAWRGQAPRALVKAYDASGDGK